MGLAGAAAPACGPERVLTMNANVTTESAEGAAGTASSPEPSDRSLNGGILVGYDGSAGSRLALDWATETAKERGTRLTIVHGVSLANTPGFPAMDLAQVEPIFERSAREIVAEGEQHAREVLETTQITTQYWLGSPAGQIIEASKDADLVVVGSRGRGRLLGGLLGSTSYAVAAHAHCPVVIVRAPAGKDPDELVAPSRPDATHPVVVGVDDSPAADRAVEAAAEAAAAVGARLHVVRVAQPMPANTWLIEEAGADARAADDAEVGLQATEDAVRQVADRVRAAHPDLEVTSEALVGDPGATLAARGADAGLIVVGSRGRGGFAGMLLGSVSHRVIHDAVCPVMVVR